ncbi:penicillin-binding protein 2 [Larsenimonas rhizosphaerae]|uniref:Peptidoglycan D,D-transpeptidase MrdA n=1 Tax=Larsenimonas rhizosphaerae TaxID=2944682 RepID=A0AA41ZKB8_9GAMM|nr:penicillin-binding protein 2 [Larsenimonas rhizosphaerae]MCM2130837.1 penicillin-binding protein 2 [Larsenimonas rhizosphaerae]MCX2523541.1 penicillin-binding protein 2 [Larsenimonas rhizosphaerae]
MRPRRRATLNNTQQEISLFRRRSIVALLVVVLLMSTLIGRLVYLQVIKHDVFITRSDNNRMRVEPLPPNRGLIFDRNHRVLAENRPTYNLTIVRERADDADETLRLLVDILNLPKDDIALFERRSRQRQRPYQSALLMSDLTEAQIANLAVNRYRLPGVDVEAQLLRYYPNGYVMSHVLGYVGRISEKDLKRLDAGNYAGTHFAGKLGIERFYEDELHGKVGYRTVETNARGRALRELDRTPPMSGKNLTLTIDSDLQSLGYRLLEGKRGAIVAINPATGGILAMVSTPGYDINKFVTGIGTKDYRALQEDHDLPLYNRAVRGQYPPASTVKPYMALAGLENGVVTPQTTVYDPGYYRLPNDSRRYRNWLRWGHGRVNMRRALRVSNDTYFYTVAHDMGITRLSDFMKRFGFGTDYSMDVWGAQSGIMPSPDWKRGRFNKPWYPGETLSVGIGQGYWLATPLQMATAAAVLANKGKWVRPHLAMKVGDTPIAPPFAETPPDVELKNSQWWHLVDQGLEDVIQSNEGTARSLKRGLEYTMAGKTGTAQVFTLGQNQKYNASELRERLRDHALFMAFAPVDEPQIAIALIIENGGGDHLAAPIGRKMLDAWLLPRMKKEAAVAAAPDIEELASGASDH